MVLVYRLHTAEVGFDSATSFYTWTMDRFAAQFTSTALGTSLAFAASNPSINQGGGNRKGTSMNWDQIEGKWKQYAGKVREKWGKLTEDELDVIGGKRDRLAGKLQERYGLAKEAAEKEISEFERSLKQ